MAKDKCTVEITIKGKITGVDVDDVQKLRDMAPADIVGRLFNVGVGITSEVLEIPEKVEAKSKKK